MTSLCRLSMLNQLESTTNCKDGEFRRFEKSFYLFSLRTEKEKKAMS
jgi:hypothetical protein